MYKVSTYLVLCCISLMSCGVSRHMEKTVDTHTVTVADTTGKETAVRDAATEYTSHTETDEVQTLGGDESEVVLTPTELQPVTDAAGNKAERLFRNQSGKVSAEITVAANGSVRFRCKEDSFKIVTQRLIKDSTYQRHVSDSLVSKLHNSVNTDTHMTITETVDKRGHGLVWQIGFFFLSAVIGVLIWEIIKKISGIKNLLHG